MYNYDTNTFSIDVSEPRLLTNIKLVITEDPNISYLDRIVSNSSQSSNDEYKDPLRINNNLSLISNIQKYCKSYSNLSMLFDNYKLNYSNIYEQHTSNIYNYGAYSAIQDKIGYKFRFLAPICIVDKIPDFFIIKKLNVLDNINYKELDYKSNIIKIFDLRNNTMLKDHFIVNGKKDINKLTVNFEENKINTIGYDIKTTSLINNSNDVLKSMYFNERTITEFDNIVTDSFKRNNMFSTNMLNIEFAFDDTNIDGNCFNKYLGYYCNIEDIIETPLLYDFSTNKTFICDNITTITQLKETPLETLKSTVYEYEHVSTVENTNTLCRMDVLFNPPLNSELIIKDSDGNTILMLKFTSDLINVNPNITCRLISDKINEIFNSNTNNTNLALTSKYYVNNDINERYIILEFDSINDYIGNITIYSTPIQLKFDSNTPFLTINKECCLLVDKRYDDVDIIGDNGYKTILIDGVEYNIVNKYRYVYDNNKTIICTSVKITNTLKNISFKRIKDAKYYSLKQINHCTFDKDYINNGYENRLDFDITLYTEYLKSIINSNTFLGKYKDEIIPPTTEELLEYKQTILKLIDNYGKKINFNNTNKQFLIKSINENNEFTNCDNEYDYLKEYDTVSVNRSESNPTIKWKYYNGDNALSLDYRLNIALPFRIDNISPSLFQNDRLLSILSHHYFVITTGLPKYYNINSINTNILSSYTNGNIDFDVNNLQNGNILNYLEHNNNSNVTCYNTIKYNNKTNECDVMFRGILYKLPKQYENYKFTVLVFTNVQSDTDTICDVVVNENDKIVIVYIKFFIPEPILTTLEGEIDYAIDRSIFYMSENAYSTINRTVSYGDDNISLILKDNSSQKTLFGLNVGTNWIYEYEGEKMFNVKKGNIEIFNKSLIEIANIGDDFTYFVSNVSNEIDADNYGYKVTLKDIQELNPDYLWCKDIIVTQEYGDINGIPDLDIDVRTISMSLIDALDLYDEYYVFDKINSFTMLPHLSYYNAKYEKILGKTIYTNLSDFNNRYSSISAYSFYNFLLKSDIVSIIKPYTFDIAVNLYENNNEIVKNNVYKTTKLNRYNGVYTPIIKPIFINGNLYDCYRNIEDYSKNSKYISKFDRINCTYHDLINESNTFTFFDYVNEFNSISSILLNTQREFKIQYTLKANVSKIELKDIYSNLVTYINNNSINIKTKFTYEQLKHIIFKIFTINKITRLKDNTNYKFVIENDNVTIIDRESGFLIDVEDIVNIDVIR